MLETFESIFFVLAHEVYVWMKVVTSSNSRAFDASCHREFDKVNVASLESSQVSHTCAEYTMVW